MPTDSDCPAGKGSFSGGACSALTLVDECRVDGCLRGPAHAGPPDGFDADKFARGQRVAMDNLFSLAYAELVSMLMMFAFEDQTVALLSTGKSDTPSKAYFRPVELRAGRSRRIGIASDCETKRPGRGP